MLIVIGLRDFYEGRAKQRGKLESHLYRGLSVIVKASDNGVINQWTRYCPLQNVCGKISCCSAEVRRECTDIFRVKLTFLTTPCFEVAIVFIWSVNRAARYRIRLSSFERLFAYFLPLALPVFPRTCISTYLHPYLQTAECYFQTDI